MPEWTGEQLAVISSRAEKIICSAAAGSGKTTVMVERIIRLLEQHGKDAPKYVGEYVRSMKDAVMKAV